MYFYPFVNFCYETVNEKATGKKLLVVDDFGERFNTRNNCHNCQNDQRGFQIRIHIVPPFVELESLTVFQIGTMIAYCI